jgi:hypothetical protein
MISTEAQTEITETQSAEMIQPKMLTETAVKKKSSKPKKSKNPTISRRLRCVLTPDFLI